MKEGNSWDAADGVEGEGVPKNSQLPALPLGVRFVRFWRMLLFRCLSSLSSLLCCGFVLCGVEVPYFHTHALLSWFYFSNVNVRCFHLLYLISTTMFSLKSR